MKLVLHIVGKDLRRLRGWLLAWAGVLALPVAIGFGLLARRPLDGEAWNLPTVHALLLGLEGLVAYVLTLLLIQEDALVGTRQFCLTRPISRGRLLAAKTLAAVVVLWLPPVVVSLPWWWWCGFGLREIAVAILELGAMALLIALAASVVAVLTDSLARALLWTMVLAAAVAVAGLFFGVAAANSGGRDAVIALQVSRAVIAVGAVAVEFAIVIVMQFYRRSRGPWLIAAAMTVVATLLMTSRSTGMLMVRRAPREMNAQMAEGIDVRWRVADAERLPAGRIDTGDGLDVMQRIETRFDATGIPADKELEGLGGLQHFALAESGLGFGWADLLRERGPAIMPIGGQRLRVLKVWDEDEETHRWIAVHRKWEVTPREPDIPEGQAWLATTAYARPSIVARMRKEPVTYEARLWMRLARVDLLLEEPLAAGPWHTERGFGRRIESVDFSRTETGGYTDVRLVETRPEPILGRLIVWMKNSSWFENPWRDEERQAYVVLARERGEILDRSSHDSNERELVVNGVRVRWLNFSVPTPRVVRNDRWVPLLDMRKGVTIGKVKLHPEAVFSRHVKVEPFEFAK